MKTLQRNALWVCWHRHRWRGAPACTGVNLGQDVINEGCHFHGERWERVVALASEIDAMQRALLDPETEAMQAERRVRALMHNMRC